MCREIEIGNRATQLLSNLDRITQLGFRQEHEEFLASPAGNNVPAPHFVFKPVPALNQQSIGHGVAIPIIDLLEMVEIHHDDRENVTALLMVFMLALKALPHAPTIHKARQLIGKRGLVQKLTERLVKLTNILTWYRSSGSASRALISA
jgi:hypothetical protein